MGATVAGFVALLFVGSPASARTLDSFYPARVPVVMSATGPDGQDVSFDVIADPDLLNPGQAPSVLPALPSGETYFEVHLQCADDEPTCVSLGLPLSAGSVVTGQTTVAPTGVSPGPGSIDTDCYFPVSDAITQATLLIGSATVTDYANGGTATTYTVHPTSIAFVTRRAKPVPSAPAAKTRPSGRRPGHSDGTRIAHAGHSDASAIALGSGALALLVAGGGGLVSWRRRRAFYRTDREGRVVLVCPPLTTEPGAEPPPAIVSRPDQRIVVKILGWLEITRMRPPSGTEHPVAAPGPVSEIIVFLVLNPGRSFTSIQLREAIWCLGRSPITSATFRKYMVELREAFGAGVVVTERYRYELTAVVTSDVAMFRTAAGGDDPLAGPEEVLALVRGPVLNGCFDGKKNSPFAWAVGTANQIEDEVTSAAFDLAVTCLRAQDPARASRALSHGLLCSATNLRLRLLELEVGIALGGTSELARRLESGRVSMASFPEDVQKLEEAARRLGAGVTPI
jgi:hypothetical protein